MPYAVAMSLGGFCQVAYQLKRSKLAWAPSPFDWLVTPFDSLENIIREGGARFGADVSRYDNGFNRGRDALCNSYNVMHAHDFPVNEPDEPIIDALSVAEVRGKFRHKCDQFLRACQSPGRKLFVRLGGSTHRMNAWPYMEDESPTKMSSLARLCESLAEKCGDDFDILFVTYENVTTFVADAQIPSNVIFRNIPLATELTWEGAQETWALLLAGLPTRDENPAAADNQSASALAPARATSRLLSFVKSLAGANKGSAEA